MSKNVYKNKWGRVVDPREKYSLVNYILEDLVSFHPGSAWLFVPPLILMFGDRGRILIDVTMWMVLAFFESLIFLLIYWGYKKELNSRSRFLKK